MPRAKQPPASREPAEGVEPTGPLLMARERALRLARTQASDQDILAALRALFCTGQPGGKPGALQARDLERSFGRWAAAGQLEDARALGRLEALEALQETATDPDARDRTAAATYLARRQDEPVPRALAEQTRKLEALTPAERRAHFLALADAELGGQG